MMPEPARLVGPAGVVTFEQLVRLPLVARYETAFRKATGIELRLVPAPPDASGVVVCGGGDGSFCRLIQSCAAVRRACGGALRAMERPPTAGPGEEAPGCLAGLRVLAAPVVIQGRHLATWVGGPVLHSRPTWKEFVQVAKRLAALGVEGDLPRLQAAYLESQVVPEDQFDASGQLLRLFSTLLGETAERWWHQGMAGEPPAVTRAKDYVQRHLTDRLKLADVAAAAHMSPYHFSRVFHAATGTTFTEYVTQLRVERAKQLLGNPFVRVSEVTFSVGFGSISQFNTVFRRWVGMSPTQFRAVELVAAAPVRPGTFSA